MTKQNIFLRLGVLLGYGLPPAIYLDKIFERACLLSGLNSVKDFNSCVDNDKKLLIESTFYSLFGFDNIIDSREK